MIREREKRIPVEISCWLERPDGLSCVTTFDLSDAGVCVASSDPLPEGRVILLKFFTPFAAGAITLKAEVVWSRTEPEGGMGLRFLEVDDMTKGILRGTVRLLRMRKKNSPVGDTGPAR